MTNTTNLSEVAFFEEDTTYPYLHRIGTSPTRTIVLRDDELDALYDTLKSRRERQVAERLNSMKEADHV